MLAPDARPAAHSAARPLDARRSGAHAPDPPRRIGDRLAAASFPDRGTRSTMYLRLCLFEPDDPFDRARLQCILDEAVDYLRTTFRYAVAEEVAQPARVQDLFLLASGRGQPQAAPHRLPGAEGDARGASRRGARAPAPRPRQRGRALADHHPARGQLHRAAPARRISRGRGRRQREDAPQPDHQAAREEGDAGGADLRSRALPGGDGQRGSRAAGAGPPLRPADPVQLRRPRADRRTRSSACASW